MNRTEVISAEIALSRACDIGYIAVIPYSSNITVVNNRLTPVLSVPTRASTDAGEAVWEHHQDAELLMIGETCYPGLPSTSELEEKRVLQIRPDFPDKKRIILDEAEGEKLDNTVLHVRGLADYLSRQPESRVLAVGLRYHAERVLTHAHANGLEDVQYVAAEDVLHATGRLSEYAKRLAEFRRIERSEKGLRLLAKMNPNGGLFVAAMKKSGPRVVDVVDTESGPKFISTLARKRLAEEQQKLQLAA
ncbi:MAG: hypothetical protein ACHQT9_03720 [Candidatus Saccharimonadales bacterium]